MTWVLWGFLPERISTIKLIAGVTQRQCNAEFRRREAAGWVCAIYRTGTDPVGLKLQEASTDR